MATTIPVTIHIFSQMTNLSKGINDPSETPSFIEGDVEAGEPDVILPPSEEGEKEEEEVESIRFSGDGILTDFGDRLELVYREDSLIGMEGCTVTLLFEKGGRHVSMIRSGGPSATMIFSADQPRQHCTYNTGVPSFPLQLCIHTRSLVSSVTARGGRLAIDYIVEIRGVPTERALFRLDLHPQPEAPEIPTEYHRV